MRYVKQEFSEIGSKALDAVGGIEMSVIEEVQDRHEKRRMTLWKRRLAVACTILFVGIAGTTVFAVLSSSGILVFRQTNPDSDKKTAVDFVVDGTHKVPLASITGKIRECKELITEQVKEYDIVSSSNPQQVGREFKKIEDAIEYIGYDGLVWPKVENENPSVNVTVYGSEEGDIQEIQLESRFRVNDEMDAVTDAWIFTEESDMEMGVRIDSFSGYFEGVDYSGNSVIENGRSFLVTDPVSMNGWYVRMAFWQENDVIYSFYIRYKEVREKEADDLVTRWMKAF